MARSFITFITAILVATMLGGCIVLPVGHDGYGSGHHRHWGERSWGDRHDGGYRYRSDRDGYWRYRGHR